MSKHLEHRVGLVQGLRNHTLAANGDALNKNDQPFRVFGRIRYHVFEPQTGFFYTGTTLGEKKILNIGASYIAQADYTDYDGGTTLLLPAAPPAFGSLGKEKLAFFEAGFIIRAAELLPFVQWSEVRYDDVPATNATLATRQDKHEAGLAWFPFGHKFNLKLAYAQLGTERSATDVPDRAQVVSQVQFFHF